MEAWSSQLKFVAKKFKSRASGISRLSTSSAIYKLNITARNDLPFKWFEQNGENGDSQGRLDDLVDVRS
jgi:hypothetical protein